MIDDIESARALHVVFVAHWIGGVGFVTLVALPLARAYGDAEKGWALFEAIEARFAAQVRFSIPLAGATGLWMVWRLDLWGLFAEPAAWWMDAMVLLWLLFMLIVFVIEPLAHRRVAAMAAHDPEVLLIRLSRVHRVLLAAGIITIFGAVAARMGECSDDGSVPPECQRTPCGSSSTTSANVALRAGGGGIRHQIQASFDSRDSFP